MYELHGDQCLLLLILFCQTDVAFVVLYLLCSHEDFEFYGDSHSSRKFVAFRPK